MKKILCRGAEWLSLQSLAWTALVMLALIGIFYTFIPALADFTASHAPALSVYFGALQNLIRLLGGDDGAIRSFFWSLLAFCVTVRLVVCPRRKALIEALAEGYWTNFVAHIIEKTDFDLVVVRPTYGLYEDPDTYLGETVKAVEHALNVRLEERYLEAAGRAVFVARRDGLLQAQAFDFGRNLIVLGGIVKQEVERPFGGIVCTADTKFEFLSNKVYDRLAKEKIARLDPNGRVRIVDRAGLSALVLSAR